MVQRVVSLHGEEAGEERARLESVESTPRERTEAGKVKDWLSRGLPLLKSCLESDPQGWKRVLKLQWAYGCPAGTLQHHVWPRACAKKSSLH